jgi:hypothetical protein
MLQESVMDLDSAFQVNPDQDSILIQGFDGQKLKKKNTAKFLFQKLQFTYP